VTATEINRKGGIPLSSRFEKVAQAIKQEVSLIIHDKINDPRIGFVTVTRVELTEDFRYSKIYFSRLGSQEDCKKALDGLISATGYIRKLLGEKIRLRFVPEIEFKFDEGISYSIHIAETLEKLKNQETSDEVESKE